VVEAEAGAGVPCGSEPLGASAVAPSEAAGAAAAPPLPLWAPAKSSDTSSPSDPSTATVVPTSASPSVTTIFRSTPSASASTSCVTLSVSSSKRGSPLATLSPSDLSQRTIVPDSMPCPRRGSLTSTAIALPSAPDQNPLARILVARRPLKAAASRPRCGWLSRQPSRLTVRRIASRTSST
jgi:hypothetical protein